MHASGEFDPEHCLMLANVSTEVCETCGLKMCKLLELIKVAEEVNS